MLPLVCLPVGEHYQNYGSAVNDPDRTRLGEDRTPDECAICTNELTKDADTKFLTETEDDDEKVRGEGEYEKGGYPKQVERLACDHFFHTNCLGNWMRNDGTTCPICRRPICGEDLKTLSAARPGLIPVPNDDCVDEVLVDVDMLALFADIPAERMVSATADNSLPMTDVQMWEEGLQRYTQSLDYSAFNPRAEALRSLFRSAITLRARPSLYGVVDAMVRGDPGVLPWREVLEEMGEDGWWYRVFGAVSSEEMTAGVVRLMEHVVSLDDGPHPYSTTMHILRKIGVRRRNEPVFLRVLGRDSYMWQSPESRGMSEADVLHALELLSAGEAPPVFDFLQNWVMTPSSELRQLTNRARDRAVLQMAGSAGDDGGSVLRRAGVIMFLRVTGQVSPHAETDAFVTLADKVDATYDRATYGVATVVGSLLPIFPNLEPGATSRFFARRIRDDEGEVVVPASRVPGWPTSGDEPMGELLDLAVQTDVRRGGTRVLATMTASVLRIGTPPYKALERGFVKASYFVTGEAVISALWSKIPDHQKGYAVRAFLDAWRITFIDGGVGSFPSDRFAVVVNAVGAHNIPQELITNLRGWTYADVRVLGDAWKKNFKREEWGERNFPEE